MDRHKRGEGNGPSVSALEPLAPSKGDGAQHPAQQPPLPFHSDTHPSQARERPSWQEGWVSAHLERELGVAPGPGPSPPRPQPQREVRRSSPHKGRGQALEGSRAKTHAAPASICTHQQLWAPRPLPCSLPQGSPRSAGPSRQEAREKEEGPHGFRRAAATAPLPAAPRGQGPGCPGAPGSGSQARRGPWDQGKGPPRNPQEAGQVGGLGVIGCGG